MDKQLLIQLIDSDLGHTIQSWEIPSDTTAQIGRSVDSDVVIRNPYVSRCHAYINPEGDGWTVNSVSQQGLLCDGEVIQSLKVDKTVEFRLSRRGPLLRLMIKSNEDGQPSEDDLEVMTTISPDAMGIPMLTVDREKRDEEVAEFEKLDYFSSLKEIASQLKKKS